ncbi:hypothetical protein SBOR_6788 [Sclerotinia borealis F-4128]|uniref:alpha-amylase n=1 Tax=Sclerotinia borealis (strain F-4128) TaxID=1432307 RepID=W9CDG1_SCLBF|nr:hypothetical protein SBOR_6788 [Sclerotinia borealis F-4128]
MKYSLLPFVPLFVGLSQAASSDDWASRSIYQVLTDRYHRSSTSDAPCNITNYCGGTWNGITENLDYIQNMGFTAIQISPVNLNINSTTIYGEAFHGYWQTSLYDLNPNFGSADDLKNLSAELHKRKMYLLVDVVASEMAVDIGNHNMTADTKIDYSAFSPAPFNDASSYNSYCPIVDWQNVTEYQDCWLGFTGVATPDIKTQDKAVAAELGKWIKTLVNDYSIDGIRVDGAKQISYDFFQDFVEAAGVYPLGEVEDGDAAFTCNYQQYTQGLENYPVYYTLIRAFTAGAMSGLVEMIKKVEVACKSTQYLANFIENQDQPRFASYSDDETLAANAMAFTILADGIPKYYYGQEQHLTGNYSPYNRQALWENSPSTTSTLYNLTSTLNTIRNHAISINSNYISNSSILLYTDDSTYATRKGPNGAHIVSVLSNQGSNGGSYTLSINNAADPGTKFTEVVTCKAYTASGNGTVFIEMDKGEPRVLFPTYQMNGTGICGNMRDESAGTGNTASPSATGTETGAASATSSKKGGTGGLRVSSVSGWVLGGVGLVAWGLL